VRVRLELRRRRRRTSMMMRRRWRRMRKLARMI
jgi:hypothetical protein